MPRHSARMRLSFSPASCAFKKIESQLLHLKYLPHAWRKTKNNKDNRKVPTHIFDYSVENHIIS
jgi:hypothetical protein